MNTFFLTIRNLLRVIRILQNPLKIRKMVKKLRTTVVSRVYHQNESCLSWPHPLSSYLSRKNILMKHSHFGLYYGK